MGVSHSNNWQSVYSYSMPSGISSAPRKLKLGIDLGTTNSCAFFSKGGAVECLDMENGKNLLPSFVEFKSGKEPSVGYAAKRRIGAKKASVVFNAKRLIGRSFSSDEVQQNLNICGCPVKNRNGSPAFYLESTDSYVTPIDVATEILKKIINQAEARSDCKVSDLCITIPANFNENQRSATLRAALNCNIWEDHLSILNEPTAAALCYGFENEAKDEYILVYDLGGGTFDVSILRVTNGQYSVKMYEGNNNLGGADFDRLILDWITKRYREVNHCDLIPDTLPEPVKIKYRRRLLQIAEEAKIALSVTAKTEIAVSNIVNLSTDGDEGGYDFELDRQTMNKLLESEIDRTLDTVRSALSKAHLTKRDIDHVVLVGGSSRLLLVQEKITSFFGKSKMTQATNCDECVAKGACLSLVNRYQVDEIIAYSLGQLLIGNRIQCIIPVNSKLPTKESVFNYTTADNQDSVTTAVFQGKQERNGDEVDASQATQLMPFTYRGFRRLPAGEVEFKTTFEIQQSGIVYVTVVETATGRVLLRSEKMEWNV